MQQSQLIQFITSHWLICSGLLIVAVLIIVNEIYAWMKKGKEILPAELVNIINTQKNFCIVDIRDKEKYGDGHIIGAINVDATTFAQENNLKKYKDTTIIIVCERGISAGGLASKLSHLKPLVLSGGMAAWREGGMPMVRTNK